MAIAKMRLYAETINEVKASDPHTALTLCALKRLVRNGDIPSVKIGRKTLINYDALMEYLDSPTPKEEPGSQVGQIRRVG